jgi:Domain of unknown function (DUF4397)
MRRISQVSLLCFAATALAACKPDEVVPTESIPTAGLRFINAVPDSAGAYGIDFRFVDIVESNAQFRIAFRNTPVTSANVTAATSVQFKNARAGQRHFRIFLSDSIPAIASTVLKDSTLSLEAGHNYTVLLWGAARSTGADRMHLTVIDEAIQDPGASVALRVINATSAAIDARQYAQNGTLPPTATWANVAPFSASAFVTATPGNKMFNVQPAGGGTNLFSDALAIIGAAGTVDIEASPGTTIAGSAVTLIVFPRSTAGARTPQATTPINYTVPGPAFIWDRRPNRTCTLC